MPEMFRQVAEIFPQRPLPRSSINPHDKSTLVSIFPVAINETKETINPKNYKIPAGSFENPSVVVIGAGSWWIDRDEKQPPIEVMCSSVEIAESIISDYTRGMMGVEDASGPGLFFIPGEHKLDVIKIKYTDSLKKAKERQDRWFNNLIQAGDVLWATGNGNPIMIWGLMKMAAVQMGQSDKPWLANAVAAAKIKCFACGNLRDPKYPVCSVCRAIDPTHPMAEKVKFAG